ncbi:MAG: transposase [Candidatus Zambryskibacteria bacterium]|nr:transposase [Candidatus Zambryskibacteria bacterium]
MRIIRIAPGEHYHIYNRAINKQVIFHNTGDYFRFLFLILYFQSPIKFQQLNRIVKQFVQLVQYSVLDIKEEVIRKRNIELVAFCIMPNHFHLILKELEEGAIATYMQRVLNAYSKYYNTKYEKSGHVFQGPYRAVHVVNDRQLLHLSAYIHRNPREISRWFEKENQYPWSSYQDIIGLNRWDNLLLPDVLMGEFKDKKDYDKFVKTSPAKLAEEELLEY